MTIGRNNKMQQILQHRVRVTLQDSRNLVGTFRAFDKHMNMVLIDCEEFRKVKAKNSKVEKEDKRILGFVLVRGESIVTLTEEGPPPPEEGIPRVPIGGSTSGQGMGRVSGRGMGPGMSGVPVGLQGPVRGVGGPAQQVMIPAPRGQLSAPPQMAPGPPRMGGPPGPGMGGPPGPGIPGMMAPPPGVMIPQMAMGRAGPQMMGMGPPPHGMMRPPGPPRPPY